MDLLPASWTEAGDPLPVVSDKDLVEDGSGDESGPPLLSALPAYPSGDPWVQIIDEVGEISKLGDDWDGEGALEPKVDAVRCALEVIIPAARQSGAFSAPTVVTAAPNGDLILEWQMDEGYRQIRIGGRDDVTLSFAVDGQPATHRRVLGPR